MKMHLARVLMMAAAVCTMAGCAQLRTNDGREGFVALAEEWWHFTLADEPYPDTCFDFPVECLSRAETLRRRGESHDRK